MLTEIHLLKTTSCLFFRDYKASEIQKHLKSGLFESQISNGVVFKWSSFSYSPNHSKTGLFKIQPFLSGFQMVWQNGGHLSRFQLVGLPDYRSNSKFRPLETNPLFDHSKFRLVRISDPHCLSWKETTSLLLTMVLHTKSNLIITGEVSLFRMLTGFGAEPGPVLCLDVQVHSVL